MAYIGIIFNFQYKFRFKASPEPQNGGHFENFKIFETGSFWHHILKDHCQLSMKKICLMQIIPEKSMFDANDVIGDVTA